MVRQTDVFMMADDDGRVYEVFEVTTFDVVRSLEGSEMLPRRKQLRLRDGRAVTRFDGSERYWALGTSIILSRIDRPAD